MDCFGKKKYLNFDHFKMPWVLDSSMVKRILNNSCITKYSSVRTGNLEGDKDFYPGVQNSLCSICTDITLVTVYTAFSIGNF